MIEARPDLYSVTVDLTTIDLYGLLLANSHRLRREVCINQLGWSSPDCDEQFEFDRFDNLASARYLIVTNDGRTPLAMARLIPTIKPYMIESLGDRLGDYRPPKDEEVWELSRLVFDHNTSPNTRMLAVKTLERALAKFAARQDIRSYLCWASMDTMRLMKVTGHDITVHVDLADDEGKPTSIVEFAISDAQFAEAFRDALKDDPQRITKAK